MRTLTCWLCRGREEKLYEHGGQVICRECKEAVTKYRKTAGDIEQGKP
jgi:hypothetical protein